MSDHDEVPPPLEEQEKKEPSTTTASRRYPIEMSATPSFSLATLLDGLNLPEPKDADDAPAAATAEADAAFTTIPFGARQSGRKRTHAEGETAEANDEEEPSAPSTATTTKNVLVPKFKKSREPTLFVYVSEVGFAVDDSDVRSILLGDGASQKELQDTLERWQHTSVEGTDFVAKFTSTKASTRALGLARGVKFFGRSLKVGHITDYTFFSLSSEEETSEKPTGEEADAQWNTFNYRWMADHNSSTTGGHRSRGGPPVIENKTYRHAEVTVTEPHVVVAYRSHPGGEMTPGKQFLASLSTTAEENRKWVTKHEDVRDVPPPAAAPRASTGGEGGGRREDRNNQGRGGGGAGGAPRGGGGNWQRRR